jgi:hypothetical protein
MQAVWRENVKLRKTKLLDCVGHRLDVVNRRV